MRKMDKKIEKQLRTTLTEVCNIALKEIHGFQWLTHQVNYSNFPKSLRIICVFDTDGNLSAFNQSSEKEKLNSLIQKKLAQVNINLKNTSKHTHFESEQSLRIANKGSTLH